MAMPNDADEHPGEPAAASGGLPSVAAPSIEPAAPAPSPVAHDDVHEEPIRSEAASARAARASAARPSSSMPRAAILTWRPDDMPGAAGTEVAAAARASSRAGGRRFALLAAGLTLAAATG